MSDDRCPCCQPSGVVRAAHRWRNNAEMIAAAASLGYLPGTVLDVTYGKHGGFWTVWRPGHLTTSDLRHPADHQWDYRGLPLPDGAYDTVVMDPPYKLSGTPALEDQDERYGVDEHMSREERMEDIRLGALECFRVARLRLLVKCQDQVEGGQVRWQTDMVTTAITEAGGRKIDRLDLLTIPRPQPANRTRKHAACKGQGCGDCDDGREPSVQQTALRNSSALLVFARWA